MWRQRGLPWGKGLSSPSGKHQMSGRASGEGRAQYRWKSSVSTRARLKKTQLLPATPDKPSASAPGRREQSIAQGKHVTPFVPRACALTLCPSAPVMLQAAYASLPPLPSFYFPTHHSLGLRLFISAGAQRKAVNEGIQSKMRMTDSLSGPFVF